MPDDKNDSKKNMELKDITEDNDEEIEGINEGAKGNKNEAAPMKLSGMDALAVVGIMFAVFLMSMGFFQLAGFGMSAAMIVSPVMAIVGGITGMGFRIWREERAQRENNPSLNDQLFHSGQRSDQREPDLLKDRENNESMSLIEGQEPLIGGQKPLTEGQNHDPSEKMRGDGVNL